MCKRIWVHGGENECYTWQVKLILSPSFQCYLSSSVCEWWKYTIHLGTELIYIKSINTDEIPMDLEDNVIRTYSQNDNHKRKDTDVKLLHKNNNVWTRYCHRNENKINGILISKICIMH